MATNRAYYSKSSEDFLADDPHAIIGQLAIRHAFDLTDLQKNAWLAQIEIVKHALLELGEGHVFFEYSIPRMGKRIDIVLLLGGIVFPIEFKHLADRYTSAALDQVVDYCLDLKNFHEQSHARKIVPILLASEGPEVPLEIAVDEDLIFRPLRLNPTNLAEVIGQVVESERSIPIDAIEWGDSRYAPTPTIIEAAQALYNGHSVEEISRSDAGAINLRETSSVLDRVIDHCRATQTKAICFVTGVPGAGKTLAGLNIANRRQALSDGEHAVFLSGNGPLVKVLREALARNHVEISKEEGAPVSKKRARLATDAFIQNIHHFINEMLETDRAPTNRISIFDEAQRAWTLRRTARFMREKMGRPDFSMSEPEFLISAMDRHDDWAVIICLVGGGQEIYIGEAGLPEWFRAIRKSFKQWEVYVSPNLSDFEYTRGEALTIGSCDDRLFIESDLHLGVSVRSFRAEMVSDFVKALLDVDSCTAMGLLARFKNSYPIVLTRDVERARSWVRNKARGTERFGLIASSGAYRLRRYGIHVKTSIDPIHWFLNDKQDVRSSFYLEDVATEFDIQGLELDWSIVAWDADLRFNGSEWEYKRFRGTRWEDIHDRDARLYLKNTYRVLMTRARQGMVIFIPPGDSNDGTRPHSYYDRTYEYLKQIGVDEI